MKRLSMIVLLSLFSTSALAAPECDETYTATDFRAWVAEADEKLSSDDVVGHGTVFSTIKDNAPCMVEPIPADAWAEFLVGLAVIEHAIGKDWQEPMTSALLTDPLVTRDYGPDEIQSFTVDIPAEGEAELTGGTFYVDGREAERPRPLPGVHIVQRQDAKTWDARVVRAGTFPAEWLPDGVAAPEPAPVKPAPKPAPSPAPDEPAPEPKKKSPRVPGGTWATFSVFGGYGIDTHDPDDGATIAEADYGSVALGVSTSGEIVWAQATELLETLFDTNVDTNGAEPGFFWDVSGIQRFGETSAFTPEAYGGLRFGFGPVSAWLGGGVSTVQVLESDGDAEVFFLGQPRLGVRTGIPVGEWAVDLGGSGGWTPQGFHGNGTLGLRSIAGTGLAFGIHGDYANASAEDETATKIRVGLRMGAAVGGSRKK